MYCGGATGVCGGGGDDCGVGTAGCAGNPEGSPPNDDLPNIRVNSPSGAERCEEGGSGGGACCGRGPCPAGGNGAEGNWGPWGPSCLKKRVNSPPAGGSSCFCGFCIPAGPCAWNMRVKAPCSGAGGAGGGQSFLAVPGPSEFSGKGELKARVNSPALAGSGAASWTRGAGGTLLGSGVP